MGYIDIKQQETYEKLKNRGWYSKWYWYFINATTTDNNIDDNTPASTITATATTNNSNNYNNNNVINNKNEKWLCIKKKLKVATYIVRLISYLVKKNAP